MPDLSTFISSIAPYIGIGTGIVVPILFWARSVSEKLNLIKDNHLAHIEAHASKTNELLVEIRTILQERQ